MALGLRYGQREVNDRPSTGSGAVTIRKRRGGWQVIVYAGLDPLTGKQRQLTRQVNGSYRQAEQVEARLRTEVADGQHAGTRLRPLVSWSTFGSSDAPPATSPSPRTRWRTTTA
jgi:hypothetical protein